MGTPIESTSAASPLAVVIRLGGPARGKGRPRATMRRGGGIRVYTDVETERYEHRLGSEATRVMAGRRPISPASAVRVYVEAAFSVPVSWSKAKRAAALAGEVYPTVKPDADNLLKMLDALNGIVFADDKQIVDARIVKRYATIPGLKIVVDVVGVSHVTT